MHELKLLFDFIATGVWCFFVFALIREVFALHSKPIWPLAWKYGTTWGIPPAVVIHFCLWCTYILHFSEISMRCFNVPHSTISHIMMVLCSMNFNGAEIMYLLHFVGKYVPCNVSTVIFICLRKWVVSHCPGPAVLLPELRNRAISWLHLKHVALQDVFWSSLRRSPLAIFPRLIKSPGDASWPPGLQMLSPGYSVPGGAHFLTKPLLSWVLWGRLPADSLIRLVETDGVYVAANTLIGSPLASVERWG